jgi:hypothetical protein
MQVWMLTHTDTLSPAYYTTRALLREVNCSHTIHLFPGIIHQISVSFFVQPGLLILKILEMDLKQLAKELVFSKKKKGGGKQAKRKEVIIFKYSNQLLILPAYIRLPECIQKLFCRRSSLERVLTTTIHLKGSDMGKNLRTSGAKRQLT